MAENGDGATPAEQYSSSEHVRDLDANPSTHDPCFHCSTRRDIHCLVLDYREFGQFWQKWERHVFRPQAGGDPLAVRGVWMDILEVVGSGRCKATPILPGDHPHTLPKDKARRRLMSQMGLHIHFREVS